MITDEVPERPKHELPKPAEQTITSILKELLKNKVKTAPEVSIETPVRYAKRLGFHNAHSPRLEDHSGSHWFTTGLLGNGMPREYVKELRGDRRGEAMDIYHHIDRQELRRDT